MDSKSKSLINLGFAEKLRDKARRRRFFVRAAQDRIAMQIRKLREMRGFVTQSSFADHVKMQQSAVSRIENAEYQGWSFKTLQKVADGLDAELLITLRPAEDAIREYAKAEHDAQRQDDGRGDVLLNPAQTSFYTLLLPVHGASFAVPQASIKAIKDLNRSNVLISESKTSMSVVATRPN